MGIICEVMNRWLEKLHMNDDEDMLTQEEKEDLEAADETVIPLHILDRILMLMVLLGVLIMGI